MRQQCGAAVIVAVMLAACSGSPTSPSGTLGAAPGTGRLDVAGFEPCVAGSAASLAAPTLYRANQQGGGATAIFFENLQVDGYDIEVQRQSPSNVWESAGWLDVYATDFPAQAGAARKELYGQFVSDVDGRFRARVRVKGCRAVWSPYVLFGMDVPRDADQVAKRY
jgi:hypothetical protein